MNIRIRSSAGSVMFLSWLPAIAQDAANTKVLATTAAASASSPPPSSAVITPSDPTWFIAGFVTGLVVGVVAARVFGGARSSGQGSSQR